jgi:GGDEF domain-containing protein
MSERILLIGDTEHLLQSALAQSLPAASVLSVPNYFDGIAELSTRPFTAVLAAAEPIERRPESAVKTLRELAGNGRVLLFGHPTLEPLSRKMLEFGVDDYVVTPASAADLQQIFGATPLRLTAPPQTTAEPSRIAQLLGVPLSDLLLDAFLLSPNDAASAAVSQINAHLAPTMRLIFNTTPPTAPTAGDGSVTLSQVVRSTEGDIGALHLILPRDEDESAARHFLTQLARLFGKIAALQDRHNRLQKLAITDELTGLYNGRYFRHFLNRIVEKARVLRFPVTLFLFDIDNFKKYNDKYGHGAGDEILRQTAALMKRCVRDHDLVARISGDEFAVVFWEKEGPRQPRDPATQVAARPQQLPQTPVLILERFRRLLATHENFPGLGSAGQGTLTISGALAVYPYDANSVADLIGTADRALMFKAKQSGKNSIFLVGEQPPVEPA